MLREILHKITKNKYYFIGLVSIFLLLIVTLGSAALRNTLSIVGSSKIQENSWCIFFDGIEKVDDSVNAQREACIVDAPVKTRIEFTVDLKPGEIYEYTVDTVNDCSIDAMVDYIEKSELTEAQKKYLDFDVIYTDEGLEPYHCTPLKNHSRRELKVTVKYKDGLDVSLYPQTDLHLDLYFDITYVQDEGCVPYSPYTLTIDPNGGLYEGRTVNQQIKLLKNSTIYETTYTIEKPIRNLYNFKGWEVISPEREEDRTFTLTELLGNKYKFDIGHEDVYLKAIWEEGDYVARIEDTYYPTIQQAFDAAGGTWNDNTVYLLRDTTEYPVNNTGKKFDFNLDAHTVTGRITNSLGSDITLINGRVEELDDNEEDTIKGAVVNHGTLSLGKNDGMVDVENSIALKGDEIGLTNDGIFNFYDGYIEGDLSFDGEYDNCPDGYWVFINQLTVNNKIVQRAYLVNDTTRAVVKTINSKNKWIVQYNVQIAVDLMTAKYKSNPGISDDKITIHAIRDFEAAYPITIPENSRILFDLENYRVWTGESITNNSYLEIFSSKNDRANLKASKTITNNSTMKMNNINLSAEDDVVLIENKGDLDLSNSEIHGQHVYAINNVENGDIQFDEDTFIESKETYGLHNTSSNLSINDGTIYGFYNEADGVEITGGNFEIYHWVTYTWTSVDHYIPAVKNSGTIDITGGTFTNDDLNTYVVLNKGTLNISDGTFNSAKTTFDNNYDNTNGTINVTGGNITSSNTTFERGNVKVTNNALVSSTNGPVVSYANLEVNNGTVSTSTGNAVYNSNVTLKTGEIVTPDGVAINSNRDYSVTQTGGTIHSLNGTAIKGTNVNISDGLIEGTTYGIESGIGITVTGGKVTSDDKAITCSSIDISGGEITSPNDAVNTTNLTITDGKVESTDGNAITVNGEGTILDGDIHGGMYGVLNNGKLIIGDDEGNISPSIPTIIGDSVGVYITGTDTYFFDGILKGQVDGYVGEITRTPLGGTPASGSEEISGETYQTDYIIQFEPWLEIEGVGQFNTINEASSAIPDGGTATIKVIKDVVPSFIQHFKDENHNKQITFDLNGHTLRSTQVAYNNESNVTVIDSVGTGKITNDICNYFENDRNMTIDNITIISTQDKAAIRNFRHGTLTITNANITANTNAIQTMGHTIINNITLNATQDAIFVENIDELYDHAFGSLTINNGTITAGKRGIYGRGSYTLNNGTITATKEGSTGVGATINGGKVHSLEAIAITGSVTVNDGEVISDTNYGLYSNSTIYVNGGYVEGTTAVMNYHYYDLYSHACWDPIYIKGGKLVGTTEYGVYLAGNTVYVTGGEIYGEVDGIKSVGHVQLGSNEGTISQSVPLVQGKHNGVTSTKTFYFFDGIIKGKNVARDGQVNLVPDASMIKDDYEFIDRVEYKTEYLEAYGNWLRVGNQEYNSLYAAQNAIEDYGTIYVIKDVNINFEQSLIQGKHATLDLNGHQVMMSKTLTTKGTNTITDSSDNQTGLLINVSEVEDLSSVTNEGNLTIINGKYDSMRTYAINNKGTMIVSDIDFETNGCITNSGYLEINGGTIRNTSSDRYPIHNNWNGGSVKVNGGEITSDYTEAIHDEYKLEVTGGTITSTVKEAINTSCHNSTTTISGGVITGAKNGLVATDTDDHNLNITGGIITGTLGSGVTSSGPKTYVTGGTLIGKVYGLDLANGGTIGTDDGTVVIDTPIIKGDSYGLNVAAGTLNFNDGILKGIDYSIQGLITNIPAGTQEYNDTENIDGKTYQTKYLIQEKDLVYNVQKDKRYNNLQVAFDEAEDNNVLELLTNIPIYYPVTNNNTHPFTLDLKGYSISTNKSITNKGNLTLTDSTSNVGTIKTSSGINLITNTNELVLNKINLINNSSSNYIVSNSGTLSVNQTIINGINDISSSGTLTVNNADITASSTGISSSGTLTVNKGIYTGANNAIYVSGNGSNSIDEATVNGKITNSRSTLDIRKSVINFNSKGDYNLPDESIDNSGTTRISQNTTITGKGRLTNSGTLDINNVTIDISSEKDRSQYYSGLYNSGTMTINNTSITVDKNFNKNEVRGITNTNNLTLNETVTLEVGSHDKSASGTHYGILTSGNGNTVVNGASLSIHGMNGSYAIYIEGQSASATLLSGNVSVTDTKYGYGVYANRGTFTMGELDEIQAASDSVSTTNPRIYVVGDIRGIGVKRSNGNFNFYDGIIWASTYTKPETTTRVQTLYEVTTYVDEATSLEYSLLEFMGDDYDNTVVAKIGLRSFLSLQKAIDAENDSNEEIVLVRSVEEPIEVKTGQNKVINLNGMSLTTSIENNGTLQLHNGTIIEIASDDPTMSGHINNYGTLILGKDDGVVSSSNMRVISEGLAINNVYETEYIHNEGRLEMYDGYIEGNPAINGSIAKIAEFARLYTKKDQQYERIYLQSLSEEAIRNRETALIVHIDPNGGIYNNSEDVKEEFLYFGDSYDLNPNPEKHASVFDGWEINDATALSYVEEGNYYKITVGLKDIELKAKWVIDPNAVAKIGEKYYFSLQEANDAAQNGDTIELIKDITLGENESTTINKEITVDLGGFTYTGPLINNGILTIYHGTIQNLNGTGIVNNKTLTMGKNDGEIDIEGTRIYGSSLGLEQNGRFNYYDGNIEGIVAMNGGVHSLPNGFHLYTESLDYKEPPTQRAILTGNPANAVAIIKGETSDLDQYFFKLTDAISSAALSNKEIDIIRSFNAAYPIEIKEEDNIVINMNSYSITTGTTFVVNGTLKLYDKSENKGSITCAQTISNNGVLNVEDISLYMNVDKNLLTNNGVLNLINSKLQATTGYSVYHNQGQIIMDENALITSNTNALYNNGTLTLDNGEIKGITNVGDLTLTGDVYLNQTTNNTCVSMSNNNAKLTITGGSCDTVNVGLYFTRYASANIDNFTINSKTSGIYVKSEDSNMTGRVINVTNSTLTSSDGYAIEYTDNSVRQLE